MIFFSILLLTAIIAIDLGCIVFQLSKLNEHLDDVYRMLRDIKGKIKI